MELNDDLMAVSLEERTRMLEEESALRNMLSGEQARHEQIRKMMEEELLKERQRRVLAEETLEDVRRECRAPFIVPALMEAFIHVSRTTTVVLQNAAASQSQTQTQMPTPASKVAVPPSTSVQVTEVPALLGDSNGHYRIHILGNSGSGKSTTAKELGHILKIPVIPMDEIMWNPGWKPSSDAEFQRKLRRMMDDSPNGWIADGDYLRKGSQIAFDEATDVIWLDPPLILYFPRIIIRTIRRLLHLEPPCCEGCPETVSEAFFSRKSILLWSLSGHWSNRRINAEKMTEFGITNGTRIDQGKMRRIGGWGGELRRWLECVKILVS
ncbi:hypothetical protein CVT24_009135 [Panaeolus cyanescens]|uniref:Adenylate kinase n=1 Tax=Panaeolus cyanescens TaxID=181874 RepID=A0A409W3T1_9AGAR|nr:hypothetical protein CVT24_009135 [Panaeolus cyanescens]